MSPRASQPFVPRRRKRGSALMLVLWAVFIMSFAIYGLLEHTYTHADEHNLILREFETTQMAYSGLALAQHPNVEPRDPILTREYENGDFLEVVISTEGARIGINALLEAGETEILRELFMRWGVDEQTASIVADSLADWVDSNSSERLNGAEAEFYEARGYPDFPFNVPFISLDEMLLVRGMGEVAAIHPGWKSWFTLYGDGSIDANFAPAEILSLFFEVEDSDVQIIIDTRNGLDGLPQTEDDVAFESVDEVFGIMGMGGDATTPYTNRITVSHPVRRIESRATIGDFTKRLILIAETGEDGNTRQRAILED